MRVRDLEALDIRFPTSLHSDGSDAVHVSPDYSCAYVILRVENSDLEGHGFSFTCGRGTEVVVSAINSFKFLVVGKSLQSIFGDFGLFWRSLANESQLRWLGPEKGVVHLAIAAIINSLWDLWAKLEKKPLWKLLADMEPEDVVKLIDFRHITDVLTPEEALAILKRNYVTKQTREAEVLREGIPAYITSVGWMGYSDEKIKKLCTEALEAGWKNFKMKVGSNVEEDQRRAAVIRSVIGPERRLMMDANQVWEVDEAIHWMHRLAQFQPFWIEEPTSPDDILGHAKIAQALQPLRIRVATGEHCQNRVVFKQMMSSGAMSFCQIDACRLGGVNEVLAVLLLAAKLHVPVCPHAGGVGLCELVQHLAIFNHICVASNSDDVMVEFAGHLHEHFEDPVRAENGRYCAPSRPGYSSEMKRDSLKAYEFPGGDVWEQLLQSGRWIAH